MTTLLAVHSRARRGHCIGTCDYRCYYALQPSELKETRRNACSCICGGANHGVGRAHAVRNHERAIGLTRAHLEAFAAARGLDPDDLVVIDRVRVQSVHKASKLAKRLLNPPPLVPGEDLFACEEVAP